MFSSTETMVYIPCLEPKEGNHTSSTHSRLVTSGSYREHNYSQVSWSSISQFGERF